MSQPTWPPDHKDDPVGVSIPNTARVWDYQLGGKDNYEIDRKAAEQFNAAVRELGAPDGHAVAIENRAFLRRAVTYLAGEAGVDQFLDLGAGLPTMENTHEIALRANSRAHVVYVDLDPIVSVHAAALLAKDHQVLPVKADLRHPDQVLGNKQVQDFLDFDRPIAILFIALLHCFRDEEDPVGVVRQFRDAVSPGSYLVVSQLTTEEHSEEAARLHQLSLDVGMSTPLVPRPRVAIERYFDGFTLIEPGLVFINEWRPTAVDMQAAQRAENGGARWFLAGVGRKD